MLQVDELDLPFDSAFGCLGEGPARAFLDRRMMSSVEDAAIIGGGITGGRPVGFSRSYAGLLNARVGPACMESW